MLDLLSAKRECKYIYAKRKPKGVGREKDMWEKRRPSDTGHPQSWKQVLANEEDQKSRAETNNRGSG